MISEIFACSLLIIESITIVTPQLKHILNMIIKLDLVSERIDPQKDKAIAHYNEGCMFASREEYEKAIEKFDEALKYNTMFAKAIENKAIAEQKLGRLKDAEKSYERFLMINPNSEEVWYRLGVIRSFLEKYEKSVEAFDEVIKLNEQNPSVWSNRGVALQRMNNYEDAIKSLKKAIQIKPDYVNAYYNLASIYALKEDTATCIEYLEEVNQYEDKKNILQKVSTDHDFDPIRDDPVLNEFFHSL